MEEDIMNKREIFKTIAELFLLKADKKKVDRLTASSGEVKNPTNITGFDSYLDIPTFMRQGRVLSGS
jgi:hypothetical protein